MRTAQVTDFWYGVCGGLVLFTVGWLRSILPYLKIDTGYYSLAICISFLCTLVITVYFLLKKQKSFLSMCSRAIVILVSYICFFILGAATGMTRFLDDLISVSPSSSSDNISGLLWAISYISVVLVCVAGISIKALLLGANKLHKTLKKKMGWS